MPGDLGAALDAADLRGAFDASAPSRRKEWLRQVGEAKAAETPARRIEKVVGELRGASR